MNDRPLDPASGRFPGRAAFEAALPLHVGGDLAADEARKVELWLEEHPEDAALLASAERSHGLLTAHAEVARSAPAPDLWPALRDELRREGLVGTMAGAPAARALHGRAGRRVAAAPARWYHRRSVAAAAALLLFGGLGALMVGGGPAPAPAGADGARPRVADSAAPAFTGSPGRPSPVRLAGSDGARTVPLRPTGGEAEHLLEGATALPGRQAIPVQWEPVSRRNDVQLTSGRR